MAKQKVTRRLAAILSADIVGYSQMMGEDEAGTLVALRQLRKELLEPVVEDHRGSVVKRMGDGWLVEFASVVDAVACAIQVQDGLAGHHAIRLRIGIHIGDVIHENEDFFGDGVNIASRLQEQSLPATVLISNDVHRLLEGKAEWTFREIGDLALKNVTQQVGAWIWPPEAAAELAVLSEPADAGNPQLFVDRFEGRRETVEQELAYGIMEGLSAALSRQTGLEIVTQEGAAGYLLRGGVRVAGQRCRVSAQLQDVAKNRQIWAENFDVDPSDPFELQDACVYRIAMAVRTQFWLYEGGKISDRDVDELSTGQLLKRAAFNYVMPDISLWRAIPGLMRRVLETDPDNFMALAMSAGSIIGEYNLGYRSPDPSVIETAFQQIEKAQRLNQRSDMVRMTKALLLLIYRKAYGEARASVQRALELNPNYNLGYSTLAHVNVWSGDYVTGIENAEHAIEGDPFHPYCYLFSRTIGFGHFGLGNFEDAATSFERADQFVPDLPYTILGLAASYWEAGDREAARQQVQQLRRLVPEIRVGIINLLEFRDPTVQTRLIGALRAAGMPDRARPAND